MTIARNDFDQIRGEFGSGRKIKPKHMWQVCGLMPFNAFPDHQAGHAPLVYC